MRLPFWIRIARWRSRKGVYIELLWQDKWPGRFNQIKDKYEHMGAFTIFYKGKIMYSFDAGILKGGTECVIMHAGQDIYEFPKVKL